MKMKHKSKYAIPIAKKVLAGATRSFANLQNMRIARMIPFNELCQIVDCAIWMSEQNGSHLYTELNRELYPYARDLNKVDAIIFASLQENRMLKKRNRQLDAMQYLYRVIGKKAFIDFYCPPDVPERTFRHWLDKAFADPERNARAKRVHPDKKIAMAAIAQGANMRITERGSIYIISESYKIRISDHPTTYNQDLTHNIIL